MGITENFQYVAVHAHINLVGWASLCLYGLVVRAFPELQASKLAPWQRDRASLLFSARTLLFKDIVAALLPIDHSAR